MGELLSKIELEEKAFTEKHGYPPLFEELSAELQEEIRLKKVSEYIIEQGMTALKVFLRAF